MLYLSSCNCFLNHAEKWTEFFSIFTIKLILSIISGFYRKISVFPKILPDYFYRTEFPKTENFNIKQIFLVCAFIGLSPGNWIPGHQKSGHISQSIKKIPTLCSKWWLNRKMQKAQSWADLTAPFLGFDLVRRSGLGCRAWTGRERFRYPDKLRDERRNLTTSRREPSPSVRGSLRRIIFRGRLLQDEDRL